MTAYEVFLAIAGIGLVVLAFAGLFGFSPSKLWRREREDVRGTHQAAGKHSRRENNEDHFGGGGSGGGGGLD